MAYSVPIITRCDNSGCTRRATERVYAYGNELRGQHCAKHAKERVAALTTAEASNPGGFR